MFPEIKFIFTYIRLIFGLKENHKIANVKFSNLQIQQFPYFHPLKQESFYDHWNRRD